MKKFLIAPALGTILIMVSGAYAQQVQTGNLEDFCRYLTAHVPNPDVAYQPSYDTGGNAVVPADLNPPVIVLPDEYHFTLNADQMTVLTQHGIEFSQPVVDITLSGNQILFNGIPYEWADKQNLAVLCLE